MPRAKRLCRGGCKKVVAGTMCSDCAKKAEARRGSRHQRGYGSEHEQIRRRLLREVALAERRGTPVICGRCGRPMHTWHALEAAHTTPLRVDPNSAPDALQHQGCNPRGQHPDNYRVQQ